MATKAAILSDCESDYRYDWMFKHGKVNVEVRQGHNRKKLCLVSLCGELTWLNTAKNQGSTNKQLSDVDIAVMGGNSCYNERLTKNGVVNYGVVNYGLYARDHIII